MPRKSKRGKSQSRHSKIRKKGGQRTAMEYGSDWFSDLGQMGGERSENKKIKNR